MLDQPQTFGRLIDRAGEAARTDWAAFRVWAEKTVSGPGDAKSAARADRFLDCEKMVDAIIDAFAVWTPPGAPRELKTIQYAMYLALRSGRADAAMLAYLDRVFASAALGDDDKRREAFCVQRYARWTNPAEAGALVEGLRRLFKSETFQKDESLRFARQLGLAAPENEPWRVAVTLEARAGGRAPGELAVANLILIAPYPCFGAGGQSWSALLWADFNLPREARDFRDIELHWRRGEALAAPRRAAQLGGRFLPEHMPKLSGLAEFPAFVTQIEASLAARFDRSRPVVKGVGAKDRRALRRWLRV